MGIELPNASSFRESATRSQWGVNEAQPDQDKADDSDTRHALDSQDASKKKSESEPQGNEPSNYPLGWFPSIVFQSSGWLNGGNGMSRDLLMESGSDDDGDTTEAELDEELDAADSRADRDYEAQLWAQFDPSDLPEGGTGTRPESEVEDEDGYGHEGIGEEVSYPEMDEAVSSRGQGWSLERGPIGGPKIKSKEFISDAEDDGED